MTYAELIRKLRMLGAEFRRSARGSHDVWRHRGGGATPLVPHHSSRESAPGHAHRMLRDLGISEEDLRDA